MNGEATVIWHDVECGGYAADLSLWEELAERCGGPVLELGCGTGRVALHLARRGYRVIGVDRDHELILELAVRAGELPVEPICADALDLELDQAAALVLAPMQFLQLLQGPESRLRCLERIAAALRPGGLLAAALVVHLPKQQGDYPPLPDVREVDGWVYSSRPTGMGMSGRRLRLRRTREIVSPAGNLSTEFDEVQLLVMEAGELEDEAAQAGFVPVGRRLVPETEDHVGSVVVLLEKST